MTAKEKRELVVAQAKPAIGRNGYSQNAVKRECVFTPYKNGKYYSDCSSFVRWMYRKAGLHPNIGGNTVGIMNSPLGVEIDCKIKSGVPTDIAALRVGDLLLFRGNDKSRAGARYVGHVEMVYAINGNTVTLVGHGSGKPKTRNMKTYCRTRWLTLVANTKIKNRGLICVKRFIADDTTFLSPGDHNEHVRAMQKALLAKGYKLPKYGADGDYGSETKDAVAAFQKANALPVTGKADEKTLALILGAPAPEAPVAPGNPMEPGAPAYPVRGIIPDISDNQGKIDLDKLAAGNDFAIFRAVQGNGKPDTQAVRNMSGCRARSFPFHAYHFLKPYSVADAEALAVKMYAACSPYGPVVYWLDIESLFPGVTHAKNRTYIQAYVAKLRALGAKKIGIYMGEYRMKKWYAPIAGIFDVLWIAHWGKNTGYLSNIPRVPGLTIGLHQYTSMAGYKGVPGAPGVAKRVDLNRLTGNVPLSWFTGRRHSGVEYPGIVQITASQLNVRSGPGTGYKVLAKIPKGRYAIRRPGSVTGWQAVAYNGMNGFVSTKYIEAVKKG
jgi:GH25 family lysozyme M1 (1,4-beta-N-acetylmuramidase)